MNIEDIRHYYLQLPHVSESFPFDADTLVFKVGSKMFGYAPLEHDRSYICLKCDPERAVWLREHYEGIEPAWHMNKAHWNGLYLDRDIPSELVFELIRHSYELVWQKLSQRERTELQAQSLS